MDVRGQRAVPYAAPSPPATSPPHRRESAPAGAPGHLLAASTEPASDTHTPTHTESSGPLDQPSSKTEVRELLPTSAKRLPQQGSVAGETPASHGKVAGLGVSPQRAF